MGKGEKLEREKNATKALTWNINGRLTKQEEREQIFLDAMERKLHFMCLQETGCKIHQEFRGQGEKIINLEGNRTNIEASPSIFRMSGTNGSYQ